MTPCTPNSATCATAPQQQQSRTVAEVTLKWVITDTGILGVKSHGVFPLWRFLKLLAYDLCTSLYICCGSKSLLKGVPGWLHGLSIQLLTLAQVMISGSWDGALSLAPGSVQSVLDILSLSLCPPLPPQRLSQGNKHI